MRLSNSLISIFVSSIITLATPVFAQETSGSVEVNGLSVTGFVKGSKIVIDAEFSATHNIPVPAPFEFIAPTSDAHKNFTLPAPGGSGIYKIVFATLDDQPQSNLQFIPFTLGQGPTEDRLNALPPLLKDFFVAMVEDTEKAAINVTRAIEIGPYPAVEMLGNYEATGFGTIVLRVVAIPNPDGEHGIVAIINGITANYPMTTVEDVLGTNASRALGTFQFQ